VTNADRTVHQGVEAGGGVALWRGLWTNGPDPDRLWFNVAYTYNDFFYDNDPAFGNNRLPGAPPHYVRAEVVYKHPSGFSFGPNIEWVPQSYFVDSANTLTTEGYLLWNLKAAYDHGDKFTAYVEARNLADKAYISSTSIVDRATETSRLFSPGTGRAIYAGAVFKW
jgi:iron complex outermembrane recepter protein